MANCDWFCRRSLLKRLRDRAVPAVTVSSRSAAQALDAACELGGEARIRGGVERQQPLCVPRPGAAAPAMNSRSASASIGAAASELLQLLVGVRQAVAAHHGLHGLGKHFPAVREVGGDRRGVGVELAQAPCRPRRARSACGRARRRRCAAPSSPSGRAASARSAASRRGSASSSFASPRLPSAFSKSIGFTLCGIVDEPTSPATGRERK